MLRPLSLLPALAAVMTIMAQPGQAADPNHDRPPAMSRSQARPAHPPRDDSPLTVTIDSLEPSYVPTRGPIRISGSVTNRTDETWRAINLHAFISSSPITSSGELAEQGEVDPEVSVGERITRPGTFDRVDELAPGASSPFQIEVPRSALGVSLPGAYWFGVHALGEADEPRDSAADGRARTFLPLVPRTGRPLDAAIVIPVRHDIRHQDDGSLAEVGRWADDLDMGGPLRALVDLGASAGSRPVTWLVDPAVPDAVRALVAGNPPRSLAATSEPEGGQGGDGDTASPDAGPDADTSPSPEPGPDEVPQTPATEPGTAWLNRLREALSGDRVLALPYGDLDVSAAAEWEPKVYEQARKRSGRELAPWGVRTTPAINAPSGFVDPTAIPTLDRRASILVSDEMFSDPPAVARTAGRRMLVTSSAGYGGPGPDDPLGAVEMRQQILSEAAVRLADGDRRPVVVTLPRDWAPSSTTGFFEGLDVDWLHLTDLKHLDTPPGTHVPAEDLAYPRSQVRRELDAANFASASALAGAGATLQNILLRNEGIADVVHDEALTGLSYASRDHPNASRVAADRSRSWIADQLGSVTVDAPRAVTLSSSSGRFAATLTNRLEYPVTVRLEAVADEPLQIEGPPLIEIPAESRTSVLLDATTDRLGVNNVQLILTDEEGTPLGSSDSLPIRSAQVSQVIWVILGTGVALLFGAIAVRLVRRVRRSAA